MIYCNKLIHQKSRLKKLKRSNVNTRRLELRRLLGQVEEQEISSKEAKEKYNQAKSEQDEFKLKAKEYPEKETLDFHSSLIKG